MLFSVSKDNVVCAWYSLNGERIGTYEGHNGTVWTVDVDCEYKEGHREDRREKDSSCSDEVARARADGPADHG